MLLNFDDYEKIYEGQSLNEGLLRDLFGGWFKKMRNSIVKKIPGNVLSDVDKIISEYEKAQTELMEKSLKEKEKIFKAELSIQKGGDATKNEQVIKRANEALDAIKKSLKAKIESFDAKLEALSDGKSDAVIDYINLKIAEVKERIADTELKQIEKFASEKQVDRIEKELDDKREERKKLQIRLEDALKKMDEIPGSVAKAGEKWSRKNKKGALVTVDILEEPGKSKEGEVRVKGKGGLEYSAAIDSLVKKVDESDLLGFSDFSALLEIVTINEGMFDKYVNVLAKEDPEIKELSSLVKNYQKIKDDASNKRIKIKKDIANESDDTKKERLNNMLVNVNRDEEKKIDQVEEKLAEFIAGKNSRSNHLMRSMLAEVDVMVDKDELKMLVDNLTDAEKERIEDIIKNKDEALKVRIKKMEKMIKDAEADTSAEDRELERQKEETEEAEVDYDADGKIEPGEKKALQQKKERDAKSPLNKQ